MRKSFIKTGFGAGIGLCHLPFIIYFGLKEKVPNNIIAQKLSFEKPVFVLFMREEIRISEIMKQCVKRLILLKRNQF